MPIDPQDGGLDDWISPALNPVDDGPDDWISPANAGQDSGPDDWIPAAPDPAPGQLATAPLAGALSPDPFAAFWSTNPASRVGAMPWASQTFPSAPDPAARSGGTYGLFGGPANPQQGTYVSPFQSGSLAPTRSGWLGSPSPTDDFRNSRNPIFQRTSLETGDADQGSWKSALGNPNSSIAPVTLGSPPDNSGAGAGSDTYLGDPGSITRVVRDSAGKPLAIIHLQRDQAADSSSDTLSDADPDEIHAGDQYAQKINNAVTGRPIIDRTTNFLLDVLDGIMLRDPTRPDQLPITVYDLKTGGAVLTPARVNEIREKVGLDDDVPFIMLHYVTGNASYPGQRSPSR